MTKNCPSCGAVTAPDARFCRRCGAPLRQDGDSESVSPQSPTIPLRDEGRTTDGLAGQDPRGASPETTRVSRAELDSILQRAARDIDPNATVANYPATPAGAGAGGPVQPPPQQQPASAQLSEEDLMKTRASFQPPAPAEEFDEEVTVISNRPFTGEVRPVHVQPVPTTGELTQPAPAPAPPPPQPPTQAPPAPPRKGRGLLIAGVAVGLVLLLGGVALVAFLYIRRQQPSPSANAQPTAPVEADQRQLAEEKVVEAEAILAAGDLEGALNLLREAVRTDPNNVRAHRRLGDILLETGARREAIEELRAVTRLDPNDFTAWRALANAQMAEGLPADAAESFKRLVALTGESDPNDLLAYADSLRLAGRPEEAQPLYQRLTTAASPDVAAAARARLAELAAAAQPTPAPTRETHAQAEANVAAGTQTASATQPTPVPAQATPLPTPVPTPPPVELTPAERYERGVRLWGSNRQAAISDFIAAARSGSADANYYLGLDIVEGRDMSTLKRAEVVAALTYFQRAQSGRNAAQARRYAQQLEKEYDRIRNQR